jgi:hypothetical protein
VLVHQIEYAFPYAGVGGHNVGNDALLLLGALTSL